MAKRYVEFLLRSVIFFSFVFAGVEARYNFIYFFEYILYNLCVCVCVCQQVDDKHTKALHMLVANGKNAHRSKSHQLNNPSYDKMEPTGTFVKTVVDPSRGRKIFSAVSWIS